MPTREMSAVGQLVCLLVLLCGSALSQSDGGIPSSPCPNVFQYVYDRGGSLQGRISIVPPLMFSSIKLDLTMTVTNYELISGFGEITVRAGDREAINDKARRGERQQIQFFVVFPPGLPVHDVPRITKVVINGRDFCPNSIKTTGPLNDINLHYTFITGLNIPNVGGNFFSTEGFHTENTAFDRNDPIRSAQAAHAHQPHQVPQPHPTRNPNEEYERSTTRHPQSVRTQHPKVPPDTTKRAPQKSPSSSNKYELKPRPGSQHRGCNVYPEMVVNCLKSCDQLQENHKARIQRRDSIKCIFPTNKPLPAAGDIHFWISNTLKIPKSYVDTIQLEEERFLVYIKMKPGALLADDDIVKRFNGTSELYSLDGRNHYDVQLTYAGLGKRHVHVRNLPTKIRNDKIVSKLAEYGDVYNLTDEYEYNVKTGVRLAIIDLYHHIPEVVVIEKHNGLITYEGQPMKCHDRCGSGSVELKSGCLMNNSSDVYNANLPPAVRPVQKPHEPQPTTTRFPGNAYHKFPTQYPYNEPEPSATQSPYLTQPPYVPPHTTPNVLFQSPSEPQHTTKRSTHNRPTSVNKGQATISDYFCGRQVLGKAVNKGLLQEEATAQGMWPWHAAVLRHNVARTKFTCGGALVSMKHVLTAAHCVTIKETTKLIENDVFIVELGRFDLGKRKEDGQQERDVVRISVHPQYDGENLSYDVAILTMSSPVEMTNTVSPVCIWNLPEDRYPNSIVGKRGEVLGWGRDENGEVVPELKRTNMPVVSQDACLAEKDPFYELYVTVATYCAGDRNGTSVCNGESSGGMYFLENNPKLGIKTWYVRGIVSRGKDSESANCDNESYVIFTDINRVYRWILQEVDESGHTLFN